MNLWAISDTNENAIIQSLNKNIVSYIRSYILQSRTHNSGGAKHAQMGVEIFLIYLPSSHSDSAS